MRAPVTIRSWALIDCLNGLGEAVMTFRLGDGATDRVIIVSVNPRSDPPSVVRVASLVASGGLQTEPSDELPYAVRDLCETLVAERFPQRGCVR
jgi:hypothetical protein